MIYLAFREDLYLNECQNCRYSFDGLKLYNFYKGASLKYKALKNGWLKITSKREVNKYEQESNLEIN